MERLKKFVKAVNPKHEFPSDIERKQKEELKKAKNNKKNKRLMKVVMNYPLQQLKQRCIIEVTSIGSWWRSCQGLRTSDEHKKAIRDGVQIKILSRLN